jgi:CBS domain-containing protein
MLVKDLMTKDYISIDKDEALSRLLGRFIAKKQKEAIILDDGNYFGIAAKKSMLDSRINANSVKVRKYVKDVNRVEKDADLKRACELMVMADSHILPVVDGNGKVEGVVFAKDIIRELKSHAKGYKAKDIDRTGLVKLSYDTRLGKAINILRHSKISHIPIVDLFDNLIGVLSIIDILERFMLFPSKRQGSDSAKNRMGATRKQRSLMDMPIESFMSKNVWQADEDDELSKVIDDMLDKEISDVVVTKYKKPVAIITVKDVLRLFSVV